MRTKFKPLYIAIFSILILFLFCAPKETSMMSLYKDSLRYAGSENKKLIVLFGADWCPDCRALDQMLTTPEIKNLIRKEYIIFKVDVGRFDQNLEVDEILGHPIAKGIPALVILQPEPVQILATTKGGEFSNASKMSKDQVFAYLKKIGTN